VEGEPLLAPIDANVSVAQTLFDFRERLLQLPVERREELAGEFAAFSASLQEVTDQLTAGHAPEGPSSRLRVLAETLPGRVDDVIGPAGARELAHRLASTHQADRLKEDLNRAESIGGPDARGQELTRLSQTALIYQELAQFLRTGH
jgi:hypothetical protein